MTLHIKEDNGAVIFKVRVQPRAAKNQVSGLFDDAVKIRLTAPPVDGEANKALQEFVAKLFRLPKGKVELLSGHTGRNKLIRVESVTLEQAQQILLA